MATFSGTRKEFDRYIGPRLRNLVNIKTKSHKKAIKSCQHCGCGAINNLESAHIKGRSRIQLITLTLQNMSVSDNVPINLVEFERIFLIEHTPFEKSILILCNYCHKKFDNDQSTEKLVEVGERIKSMLPITLLPSGIEDFRSAIIKSKKAEIKIYLNDGQVKSKIWNATKITNQSNILRNLRSKPEFRQGAWQQHGISSIEVCVIKKVPDNEII